MHSETSLLAVQESEGSGRIPTLHSVDGRASMLLRRHATAREAAASLGKERGEEWQALRTWLFRAVPATRLHTFFFIHRARWLAYPMPAGTLEKS